MPGAKKSKKTDDAMKMLAEMEDYDDEYDNEEGGEDDLYDDEEAGESEMMSESAEKEPVEPKKQDSESSIEEDMSA